MINLFKKDETTFEHNGLGSLDQNIISPEINWKDNGAFTLEFKYPLFAKHGFEIENSSIIRANDPEGSNLFFVYKITPSMGYVTVLCYQISYKLAFNSINDTNIVNKSGQNALNQVSNATQYPHTFTFSSDIQTTATSRVVRKNPIEFLLDTGLDNSFVNRWGGHIVRHNFNIAMNTAYGSNKGYTIRHKKDLKGYEAEFDESTVITRIRPIGYDGLLLPELYVDSPLINNYVEPRIQEIEYSEVKIKTKDSDEEGFSTPELAYAELRRLAKLEFSKNKVDIPTFSCKVEFVNLKDTQEYQDLKSLKQILAGDIVKVIHSEDNFSIEAQMVEYKWNPLNQSYISITLGNYTKSFTSTVSKASNLQTNLNQIAQQAQSAMTSANGKNTVYSLTYKPAITNSSTEGDLLYLKNGDKTELWMLKLVDSKLQWVQEISDATQEELKVQVAQAKTDIDDAVDSANSAVNKAQNALNKANENVTAIEANTQLINDVNTVANNAKTQAQTATNNAQTALTNAQSALDKANGVSSKVTTIETNIDTINGTLSSKANTTDLNALKGRVSTAESSITQNANDIKTKVSTTDYNKLDNRVKQAESSISQNANAITQKVSSTDVENILTGKAYATQSELVQTSEVLTSTISGVQTNVDKKADKTQVTQLSQDLTGFKTTVSDTYLTKTDASTTYPTKTAVTTQINQKADSITADVQSWTDDKLTAYSTTQQTATNITNAVADKADKSQVTQLSDQITSVVTDVSNISTSSKNLAKGTDIPFVMTGNNTTNQGINAYNLIDLYSNLVKTDDYVTVSFNWSTNATTGTIGAELGATPWVYGAVVKATGTNGATSRVITVSSSNQSGKVVIVHKVSATHAASSALQGRFRLDKYETGKTLTITNYQVQKGMIASDLSFGKANLLDNSDFKNDLTGWSNVSAYSTTNAISSITGLSTNKPTKWIRFNYADIGNTTRYLVQTVNNPQQYAGSKLRMSVYYWGAGAPGNNSIEFYSRIIYNGTNIYFNNGAANSYGKTDGARWYRLDFLVDLTNYNNPSLLTEINISTSVKGNYSTGWIGLTSYMVTEDGNLYDWSYDYVTGGGSYSQIAQLSDDINLRVSKGDVISQINVEAGKTLISSNQILLNADNVMFSGNAFIPNAYLQGITADKIVTGTLNGANINVINLNAGNIKTGTLSGTNLSMNLNTGAVQFKKGYIEGSDGRIRLDLDNSYLKSFDTSNNGFEIRNGIFTVQTQTWGNSTARIGADILAEGGGINIAGVGGVSLISSKYTASISVGSGGLATGTGTKLAFQGDALFWNNMGVMGTKNAVHVTRDGLRATPAYETAESYLGDIGSNYTRENCEVWVPIDELFSDTVNTDIAYHVFLQAYDDARFWVAEFKPDKFLIKSDKPMARFAWEIKAKRRGYENDRLVLQNDMDNKQLIKALDAGALTEVK
ncbi:MAG: phage tail protein [Streptococcaceae bacterium]|jgi:phage minor structural protein|nr:phage tail protein [Streptococcaceae bacterium]MCH4178098.1 phage tail protein [Streptococcaceae bacterium]